MLSPNTAQRKGGANMAEFINFFVSVMASVVGHYISKWLDRNN